MCQILCMNGNHVGKEVSRGRTRGRLLGVSGNGTTVLSFAGSSNCKGQARHCDFLGD